MAGIKSFAEPVSVIQALAYEETYSVRRPGLVRAARSGAGATARPMAWGQEPSPERTQPPSADGKLNIIAFGAHPDDCDQRAGGTAAKYAALGHRVRFVAVTNGDAGHQTEGGGALAARRRAEAREAGRRIGIEYVVLDNHDGELLPTPERARADHPADSAVESRPRPGAAAQRLSPRPSLHRRPRAGCRLHGRRPERRARHAGAAQEPGLHVLRGRVPEAERRSAPTSPCRSTT